MPSQLVQPTVGETRAAARTSAAVRRVTVGLDGSRAAAEALRWVAEWIEWPVTSVVALCAYPTAEPGAAGRVEEASLRAWATGIIDDVLGPAGRGVHVCVGERDVPAALVLERASRATDLLVIGRRPPDGRPGLRLGPVAHHLLAHSACPLVLVCRAPAAHWRRAVVGHDGSASSTAALRWALDAAPTGRVEVEVVQAWEGGPAERDRVLTSLARVAAGLSPAEQRRVRFSDFRGAARPVLLAAAATADVLVLGNRRGGARSVGSVCSGVVAASPVPVVVTPARAQMRVRPRRYRGRVGKGPLPPRT